MAGEFKQQCPSCEAMVSIKDESLVGKKTECTKCKYRFLVEAPSKAKTADDKKSPAVKPKTSGKEAAAKAKQEIKKAESGQKPVKKSGAKNKQMLIIGGAVGGVALVAIVAAMFLFSGGDSGKGKMAERPKRNRSSNVTPNGPNDKNDEKTEETKEMPKEEEKSPTTVAKGDGVDPDVSIRLPNDSKVVMSLQMKNFFDSMIANVLFNTAGAFSRDDFKKTFGVSIEDIDQVMLARSSILPDFNPLKKSWKMAIVRSEKPFNKSHIEQSIALSQEAPIEGLNWSKIGGHLDSLSSLLLGFESTDKISFFLADSRTIVIASEDKMNDYLKKDKGKPKKIATAAPPEAPKPADPNNPMPPMPTSPMPPMPTAPMPMPNGQPADPNAPPMPSAPPVSSGGNHFETLPLRFAKVNQDAAKEKFVLSTAVDLSELAALIPVATGFLSNFKTPGGAPIPPDIINQIKTLSKLEYAMMMVNVFDKDDQVLGLRFLSRDRQLAADFAKLVFPVIKRVPIALKEAKLDILVDTVDNSSGAASPANPNPNPAPSPNPPTGTPGTGTESGANGKIISVVEYVPQSEHMLMSFSCSLKIPGIYLKSFESSLSESFVMMKNSFETKVMGKNANPVSKALMSYVNDKKAFPRGTSAEATSNKKFGLQMPPEKRVGWIAELLPYFSNGDYNSFYKLIDKTKPWSDPKNQQVARMFIPDLLYAAPVEGTPVSIESNQPGITNFVGVGGVVYGSAEYSPDDKKRGIFGYERVTKIEDIKDGPSNTIALLLTKQNKNQPWIAGGGASIVGISDGPDALAPFLFFEKTNRNKEKEFTGIAVMADGKVRELSNKITPEIFRALCTIDGGEKIDNLDAIAPVVK